MSTTLAPVLMLGTPATAGTKLTGVTAGTSSPFLVLGGQPDITVTYTSVGATLGGTIILEETDSIDDPSGATWSQIESRAASTFTGTVKLCVHVRLGAGGYVRARISSAITGGGNIIVTLMGS